MIFLFIAGAGLLLFFVMSAVSYSSVRDDYHREMGEMMKTAKRYREMKRRQGND